MTIQESITALHSCAAIIGFAIFWRVFWREYALDRYRQALFAIRDDMFMAIAKGDGPLGFDSEEYLICRRDLNQFIRCAPSVSITQLLVTLFFRRLLAPGYSMEDFDQSISVIHRSEDERVRKFVQPFQDRLNHITLRYLLTASLIFSFTAFLSILVVVFSALAVAAKKHAMKTIRLDAVVRLFGTIYEIVFEDIRVTSEAIVRLILLSQHRA